MSQEAARAFFGVVFVAFSVVGLGYCGWQGAALRAQAVADHQAAEEWRERRPALDRVLALIQQADAQQRQQASQGPPQAPEKGK
jgi:anti-sigma factor ChrR (cupin superfamily)